jgi:hypothetical protein
VSTAHSGKTEEREKKKRKKIQFRLEIINIAVYFRDV